PKAEDLVTLTPAELEGKRGITTRIRHEVTRIDRQGRRLEVQDLESGKTFTETYDRLVIATGALAIKPPLPNIDAEGVFTLRSVEDGIRIRAALENGAKNALIIGAGPIGLELAEQLTLRGCGVNLVEFLPRLLPVLPQSYADEVREALLARGVQLRLNARVREILVSTSGKASGAVLEDGTELTSDFVIVAAGVAPNTSLAREAGLTLGLKGGIAVDAAMRTSDPVVWACGDCTQMINRITGKPAYAPLGTTANKQGRVAGAVIAGEEARFPGVLLSQACKVFDQYIAATGLTQDMAAAEGIEAAQSSIEKDDKANYYPGAAPNKINLVFARNGGRLLGAQAIGSISAAQRMNVLAAAITQGMSVSGLADLDLVYTPSVAPVYDPLLIASGAALKYVR
ncbi:MAG: FAD-dependent oxidoreductase, partial [Spirochaetales bacterium]|nr:FAD-dependent oxidoreductase [Spirochaetales bacterium]